MSSPVEPAAEAPPAAAVTGRGQWWLWDRLAVPAAVIPAGVVYLLICGGSWYFDDFLNFSIAQDSRLDRASLEVPIFGHPQPGLRLLNWVLFRLAPMNYPVAAGLLCLCLAATGYLTYRILRLAFRPSPWTVVLTALVGTTAIWVDVLAWWAGGDQVALCILADVLMVHAVLRCYLGRHKLGWGVLAGIWLVAGLAVYERALLGAAFALCFLFTVAVRRPTPREVGRVARQSWPVLLLLPVLAVAYVYYYLTHHFIRSRPGYTTGQVVHFIWIAWEKTLVPGAFGGGLTTGDNLALSTAAPPLWWQVAAELLLIGVVILGLRRNGARAVVPWLYFLPLFVAATYAIASARLTLLGLGGALEYRYVSDLVPLLVLALAATVLRPGLDHARLTPSGEAERPAASSQASSWATAEGWRAGPRSLVAPATALTAVAAFFLITALPVAHRWVRAGNVGYVRNMEASVRAMDRSGRPWSVYSGYVPPFVSFADYGPYSQTDRVARLLTGRTISTDDLTRPMYVFDADGRLRPARFSSLATILDVCTTDTVRRPIAPLSDPLIKGYWSVQLNYAVSHPTVLRFAIDTRDRGLEEATGRFQGFAVRGVGRLTFMMRLAAPTAFRVDADQPGACISDVQIGVPVARS